MTSMLSRLEGTLDPYMRAAGFAQCDHAVLDDLSWLEYRDNDTSLPYLVSIYHLSAKRMVTAEAWQPDRLRWALRQGKPESAAAQHHTWQYDEGSDGATLDREIVKTVLEWLALRLQAST
jgi:hypothetical protein